MLTWRPFRIGIALLAMSWLMSTQASAQILNSKRGFADSNAGYTDLQAVNANWYYNWGPTQSSIGNYNAMFYPMFWNGGEVNTSNINNVATVAASNSAISPGATTYVLGFNEPEVSTQANMTVASAITAWDTLYAGVKAAAPGVLLASPAVSDTTAGRAWLSSFMATESSKVNAVAFHWYADSTPDSAKAISDFEGSVNSYYNSYQKPVFITEFAVHDWGNSYTDAQIIEANREFLNAIIPWMQSSSRVAGFSWYNWFSDAGLFSGGQDNPVAEAYAYIGSVAQGTTSDIGNQNLKEHVADLSGGTLTMTGTTAGSVKYINALSGDCMVSGSMNWSLAGSSGNWVRIQPNASLVKTGSNQITFSNGTISNNGSIQVSQGLLNIGISVTGGGTAVIKGGTLALTGSGRLNSAPLIDVQPGGTLDVSTLGNAYSVANGQTLNGNGIVAGNVTAAAGSIVAGHGTITGSLTTQSGGTVRVGTDGAGPVSRIVIDNFQSYATGHVATVAAPLWTANAATTEADIVGSGGNNFLSIGSTTTAQVGASLTLPAATAVDNSSTATYFFRISSATVSPNASLGLGDQASTGTVDYSDFEAQLRLQPDTSSTFSLDARNGGAFTSSRLKTGLALNTWYNIWMVVNNATDKYDLYENAGAADATVASKIGSSLSFRNGTDQTLRYFLAFAGAAPVADGISLDDITYQAGTDLTNPTANFSSGTWSPETLTVDGTYTQNGGSTLQLNLQNPSSHDVLRVSGSAHVGGTLNVTFAVGASTPKIGDAYQLINASSIIGSFSTLQLPALSGGLAWDSSQLYSAGSVSIFSGLDGDFTQDGVLNAADIQAMTLALSDRDAYKSLYNVDSFALQTIDDVNGDGQFNNADIQALISLIANNAANGTGSGAVTAVPEPNSFILAALAAAAIASWPCRRRLAPRLLS